MREDKKKNKEGKGSSTVLFSTASVWFFLDAAEGESVRGERLLSHCTPLSALLRLLQSFRLRGDGRGSETAIGQQKEQGRKPLTGSSYHRRSKEKRGGNLAVVATFFLLWCRLRLLAC